MNIRTSVCAVTRIAHSLPQQTRRCISTSALERLLSRPVQSYISTSPDPALNLSIEHHLLQKASPDSKILFLYVNRPSIIIGRNQNPWLEVNLTLLNPPPSPAKHALSTEPPGLGAVDLVRRRSGGGTVFHDEGNVNWTVISPSSIFTRDKHAEMVVRALRSCGVDRARVNERHDVVLDQGPRIQDVDFDSKDTHVTPYLTSPVQPGSADAGLKPLKVSGSAYKLTRQRALHHGTCLLSSPNLNIIPHYLHSPAKPFITARGVESVSSPVGNILIPNEQFNEAVRSEFGKLYGDAGSDGKITQVGGDWLEVENVRKGYEELKSPEWTYLQTPQFDLSSEPKKTTSSINARIGAGSDLAVHLDLTVRYGAVTECRILPQGGTSNPNSDVDEELIGRKLHEITDWDASLPRVSEGGPGSRQREQLVNWLTNMLPHVTS